jgi:hypothetical protein
MSIIPDILNDSCISLDGWTTSVVDSSITVNDGFKLAINDAASTDKAATVQKVITSSSDTLTVEIETLFTALGDWPDEPMDQEGYSFFAIWIGAWALQVFFTSAGMCLIDSDDQRVYVTGGIVKCNATAADQIWRFEIDKTVEASSTVSVYLDGVALGTYNAGAPSGMPPGSGGIILTITERTPQIAEVHLKEVKIGTGIGSFSPDAPDILFDCEFEGTFADSVHGISPTSIGEGISLEASTRMFGSGCCKQTGVFSIYPTTLFSDGVTLSNAQSAIHSPHHYGPMLFDKDAMTLAWGDEATPVPITGDGIYTLLYNDDPTETIDATVVVSELPGGSESHYPIYLEGTPLVYTPTEELITALKENGFTVSGFQQSEQDYIPLVGDTIPHNTTFHMATVLEKVTEGYNLYIFVEGILQMPMQYLPDIYIDIMITNTFTPIPCFIWFDSFQVIAGALWTANFTPPSSGFSNEASTDRYWVGNTGYWNDTAHWSYTSGGIGGAPVPTANNDVYFDSNSFTEEGQHIEFS